MSRARPLALLPLAALLVLPSPPSALQAEWRGGVEVEGLREAFGFASIFGRDAEVRAAADSFLYRERELEALAFAGLTLRGSDALTAPELDLEARAGAGRHALTLEAAGGIARGPLAGFRLRNQVRGEDEDDGAGALRCLQELLHLAWARPRARGWCPGLRAAVDLSWAEPGETADAGRALDAIFLRYTRASVGLGLARRAPASSSCFLDLVGRRNDDAVGGSYRGARIEALHAVSRGAGGWEWDGRLERRAYDDGPAASGTSALVSYWESEIGAGWDRPIGRWALRAEVRGVGTRYDDDAAAPVPEEEPGLATLQANRLEVETEMLLRRDDASEREGSAPDRRSLALGYGFGLHGRQLWVSEGEGAAHALGGCLEGALRGGGGWGEPWLELTLEIGRCWYPGAEATLSFDHLGHSLSLVQSDYVYAEGSVLGGGRLPRGLSWRLFGSVDLEKHARPEDDAQLFSLHLALERRWNAMP